RHTRFSRDWSSDVCSSDLATVMVFCILLLMTFPILSLRSFLSIGIIFEVLSSQFRIQSRDQSARFFDPHGILDRGNLMSELDFAQRFSFSGNLVLQFLGAKILDVSVFHALVVVST